MEPGLVQWQVDRFNQYGQFESFHCINEFTNPSGFQGFQVSEYQVVGKSMIIN